MTPEHLRQTALFAELEPSDLDALMGYLRLMVYPKGTLIFKAGDPGEEMFIIQQGRVRIFTHNKNGDEITINHYADNEVFGELSPIDGLARSASASAVEDLKVYVLSRVDFLNFLNERPQIGLAMMRGLAKRLRNTTTFLEEFKPDLAETVEDVAQGAQNMRRVVGSRVADLLSQTEETPSVGAEPTPSHIPRMMKMGLFDRIAEHHKESILPPSEDKK
jgi:CRP-like cAMP-binding protein